MAVCRLVNIHRHRDPRVTIAPALTTAINGLQISAYRADVAARNIANVNTPEYRAEVPFRGAANSAGNSTALAAKTGIDTQSIGSSGVSIAGEFTDLIRAETAFKASAALVRVADDLSKRLIDVVG